MIGSGLVIVNSLTLQINLDAPISFFLQALTASPSWAVDKRVVQQYGATWADKQPIGTGPFLLKSWQQKVELRFLPNPRWYGKKPMLIEVVLPLIADASAAFNRFQAKEIDVDTDMDSASYAMVRALEPKSLFEGPALTITILPPTAR